MTETAPGALTADDDAPRDAGVTQARAEDGAETRPGDAGTAPSPAETAADTKTDADAGAAAASVDVSGLEGVPYLGDTRRQALALAGLRTRADLEAATLDQIGAARGVGLGNAKRIKEWLAVQAEMPNVAVSTPLPALDDAAPDAPVSALASANQGVQDVFARFGGAATKVKDLVPAKLRDKALDRQLEKLDSAASELAEGPDTLSGAQVREAVKILEKISDLLEDAAKSEKLSPKKQESLVEELRARRKRLEKTIGE